MKALQVLGCTVLWTAVATAAITIPGDATRGEQIFKNQKCTYCHGIAGQGGSSAPDLAHRPKGPYSPSLLAAAIWNHAPRVWTAIEAAGVTNTQLSPRDAADLFAYFYAFRYFEEAGNARRGKGVFRSKHCVDCHNLAEEPGVEGASHVQWESVTDLIQFTRVLWNHTPAMLPGTPGRMRRGSMSAEQMNDMVVYLQNLPANRHLQRRFAPGPADTGEALFRSKGCADCHTGSRALAGNRYSQTMAGFAAAMWDHAVATRDKVGEIRPDEMNALVGYLWSVQYFDDRGDSGRGRTVATNKHCDSCHGAPGSGAPALASFAGKLDSLSFASSIWSHGPAMLRKMQADQIEWPRFRDNQLGDLLAYINSL